MAPALHSCGYVSLAIIALLSLLSIARAAASFCSTFFSDAIMPSWSGGLYYCTTYLPKFVSGTIGVGTNFVNGAQLAEARGVTSGRVCERAAAGPAGGVNARTAGPWSGSTTRLLLVTYVAERSLTHDRLFWTRVKNG